jgi:hypothetical protein
MTAWVFCAPTCGVPAPTTWGLFGNVDPLGVVDGAADQEDP